MNQTSTLSFQGLWGEAWRNRLHLIIRGRPGMHVRLALPSDADILLRLANDSTVRQQSFHSDPILPHEHYRWFDEKLRSKKCFILILEINGVAVGQIRFDKQDNTAQIDYAIDSAYRGRMLGTTLLKLWPAACLLLKVQRVEGTVKVNNQASIHAFINAGYFRSKTVVRDGVQCAVFEHGS